ncbi:EB domain [Trinorchestia longiramus]|nr:EB domain [Trinorchestia longiramus]
MPSISCTDNQQCSEVQDAICGDDGTCICPTPSPVYIADISGCLKGAALNTSCEYDEQCLYMEELYGRCGAKKICTCVQGYEVKMHPNVGINCVEHSSSVNPVDPTMIGVLVGLALMFVIICVVLRLFSKARFRENRSIFNTPNPRLMNASMFKDSKLLSPSRGDRRGSRASVRAPSRTASLASVNATSPVNKSPNGSLTAKGRRGSGVSVGSGPVGSPPATALSRSPPTPDTPKTGATTSPDKNKKDQSAINIEAVD